MMMNNPVMKMEKLKEKLVEQNMAIRRHRQDWQNRLINQMMKMKNLEEKQMKQNIVTQRHRHSNNMMQKVK